MSVSEEDVDQYLETALWSSNDESDERGGHPMDRNYTVSDFVPEARARARADLERFYFEMNIVLDALEAGGERISGDIPPEWPHHFWLNRNGHGVGFWSHEELYGSAAQALSEVAHGFDETNPYVGDDGRVYFG